MSASPQYTRPASHTNWRCRHNRCRTRHYKFRQRLGLQWQRCHRSRPIMARSPWAVNIGFCHRDITMTVAISVVVPSGIPGIRWIVVIDFTIAVIINTAIAVFLSAGLISGSVSSQSDGFAPYRWGVRIGLAIWSHPRSCLHLRLSTRFVPETRLRRNHRSRAVLMNPAGALQLTPKIVGEPETISIKVCMPCFRICGGGIIEQYITVVVDIVTQFGSAWIDGPVRIVNRTNFYNIP